MIRFKTFLLLFLTAGISAAPSKDSKYWQEFKQLKNTPPYSRVFDEDVSPALQHIEASIDIFKNLPPISRLARFMFISLGVIIINPETMPTLYKYVEGLCKDAGIQTPTIFIVKQKGFFNAAAAKILTSTGGIVIGQKLLKETSNDELEAIVAHEIGHIKHNHVNKILAIKFGTYASTYLLTKLLISICNSCEKRESLTPNQQGLQSWIPLLSMMLLPDLIINKRFEKEADHFACKTDHAEGVIEFFKDLKEREEQNDLDFDITYARLQDNKSQIDAGGYYMGLLLPYYLAKGEHMVGKALKWIYHHTPYGPHPSHEARIKAAQEYLAHNS